MTPEHESDTPLLSNDNAKETTTSGKNKPGSSYQLYTDISFCKMKISM
jgi:hypothetical protein